MLAAARTLHERDVAHRRIAVTGDLFVAAAQYYLYDKRLTNYVQFIGSPGPHHTVRPFPNCNAAHRSDRDRKIRLRARPGRARSEQPDLVAAIRAVGTRDLH